MLGLTENAGIASRITKVRVVGSRAQMRPEWASGRIELDWRQAVGG
jgi:hypothetical protein